MWWDNLPFQDRTTEQWRWRTRVRVATKITNTKQWPRRIQVTKQSEINQNNGQWEEIQINTTPQRTQKLPTRRRLIEYWFERRRKVVCMWYTLVCKWCPYDMQVGMVVCRWYASGVQLKFDTHAKFTGANLLIKANFTSKFKFRKFA